MTDSSQGASPMLLLEWWKPVVGWERLYEVSNVGNVRRIYLSQGTQGGGFLKLHLNPRCKYYYVTLCHNYKVTNCRVNVLVARAFLGPRPEKRVTDHINGTKVKNWVSNLEYVTPRENILRAIELGLENANYARLRAKSPLTEQDVRDIRATFPAMGCTALGRKYGVSESSVRDIIKRRSYRKLV